MLISDTLGWEHLNRRSLQQGIQLGEYLLGCVIWARQREQGFDPEQGDIVWPDIEA